MKMVALPKGRQKSIQGPAINVPTQLHHICTLLPRLPEDAQIVALKLKRKLIYKGHYMYDHVRPHKVMAALQWLKLNNPKYKDIIVNDDWDTVWTEEDAELWQALTDEAVITTTENDITTHAEIEVQSNCSNRQQPRSGNEEMNTLAGDKGFKVVDVVPDGSCFYHAVSLGMRYAGMRPISAKDLRQQLTVYLQQEGSDKYAAFLIDPRTAVKKTGKTADVDCAQMNKCQKAIAKA